MGRSGHTALTSLLSPLSTDHITVTVEQTATRHHSCIHPGLGRARLALVLQHCLSSQSTEAANESFCHNYLVTDLCDKFSGLFIPDHERDRLLVIVYSSVGCGSVSVSRMRREARGETVNEV